MEQDNNNLDNVQNESTNDETVESEVQANEETPTMDLNGEDNVQPNPNGKKKGKKGLLIALVLLILIIVCGFCYVFLFMDKDNNKQGVDINSKVKESEYRLSGNSLEPFDLYFLQLENKEVNKIYSPLSIKYALAMLNEGTDGESKEQIKAIIGDYKSKKYINSENMSLANVMFIRNSIKDTIKEDYKNILLNKYNAELVYDSFESADNINKWVKDKTLGLLDNLVDDDTVRSLDFALINALAIDMEWNQKFLNDRNGMAHYTHERKAESQYTYQWDSPVDLVESSFKNVDEKISGMEIIASLNNYDIVKELGEDNIRKTVGDAYREFINSNISSCNNEYGGNIYKESNYGKISQCFDLSDFEVETTSEISNEMIETKINSYLDSYIESINSNYKDVSYNTEFSLYVDDDVKAFAKDLKEYNGTTLQYVGIMPINVDLNNYISNVDAKTINSILNNLKELKSENFKEGVVTEIKGYIPKFKFEYSLNLKEDLEKLGVKDIFDSGKANLSNLTSQKDAYIASAIHKANIEFTQDGIKASAATLFGGRGAAVPFDYIYEVPFEEIDLTFDKPYMFLIRDKETGEIWFTGTVYNPLLWNDDQTKTSIGY